MFEVVPFALEALVAFSAFCALLVATGLLTAWGHTFGFVLQWMADNMRFRIPVPFHAIHVDFGGPFRKLDGIVYTALQTWRDGAEIEFSWSLHKMAQTYEWTAEAIDALTRETAETFDRLWHVGLPKWAKWAALAAFPPLLLSKLIAQAVAHLRPEIVKTIKYVDHAVPQTINQYFKLAADAIPYPPWIIKLPKRVGNLERDVRTLRKALSNPKALIGAVAGAAIMANSLGLGNNWRCVTRGNIGRAARHFCGLDKWIVDLFLLGSIEAFAVTDLCEFSNLLMKQAELIRPVLMKLVDVEDALIGCGGTTKPMLFKLPAATLPPLQGVSPLAA